jgi:hypothetical protein
MNNDDNIGDLVEWFDQQMAELAILLNVPIPAPLMVPVHAVGAAPRRPRRVRRYYANFADMEGDNTEDVPRAQRRRGRGRYREFDAEDMTQWGIGRRRRRAAGAPAPAPLAVAAPALVAGGEGGEGGAAAIASALVPIIDLASEAGEAQANPGEEDMCCIAACCQNPPVFTWLRCCGNQEACVNCVAEHVRRRGWTCPLCRGDMRT